MGALKRGGWNPLTNYATQMPIFKLFVIAGVLIEGALSLRVSLKVRTHGKTTYEWHTDGIRVYTSDIRVAYEYIRVTYGWHTSVYEWHTGDMQVNTTDMRVTYEWHTSTYDDMQLHTSDIRMKNEHIRVTYVWKMSTYEWHANDIWVT